MTLWDVFVWIGTIKVSTVVQIIAIPILVMWGVRALTWWRG